MRSRFFLKLLAGYVAVVIVAAAIAELTATWVSAGAARQQTEELLLGQAVLLRDAVEQDLARGDVATLEPRIELLAATTGTRLTVALADGTVVADSAERPEKMQNHLGRPEFQQAIAKGRGAAERDSATTGQPTLYLCLSVPGPAGRVGFARVATTLPDVARAARASRGRSSSA